MPSKISFTNYVISRKLGPVFSIQPGGVGLLFFFCLSFTILSSFLPHYPTISLPGDGFSFLSVPIKVTAEMTNTNSLNSDTGSCIRFSSLNVKGMKSPVEQPNTDIAFIQETHLRDRHQIRFRCPWVVFPLNFQF